MSDRIDNGVSDVGAAVAVAVRHAKALARGRVVANTWSAAARAASSGSNWGAAHKGGHGGGGGWSDAARAASLAVRRAKAAIRAAAKPYVDFAGVVRDEIAAQPQIFHDWIMHPDTSHATSGADIPSGLESSATPVNEPELTPAQRAVAEEKQRERDVKKAAWKAAHPGKTDVDYAQALVEAQNLADYGTALPTADQIKKRKDGLSAAAALVKARMKKAWLKKNPNGTDAEWERVDAANLAAWKAERGTRSGERGAGSAERGARSKQ